MENITKFSDTQLKVPKVDPFDYPSKDQLLRDKQNLIVANEGHEARIADNNIEIARLNALLVRAEVLGVKTEEELKAEEGGK